jgi:Protein of unknown function (DUF3800)
MPKQRLYIDESGDHTLKGVKTSQWDKRYLCLLGCQFEEDYCKKDFHPTLQEFKNRHFGEELDDPVILHREEIAAKAGCFCVLRDSKKNGAFCEELLKLVENTRFTAYVVVLDKISSASRYYGLSDSHPYHNGPLTMLERYCGKLSFSRNVGDVLAEARGAREDQLLKAAYREIHAGGSSFKAASFFQRTLSSKEIKIKPKVANVPGLQLSDLLAYPAKMRMLEEHGRNKPTTGFTKEVADLIEKKYNRRYANAQVSGYGKIFLA